VLNEWILWTRELTSQETQKRWQGPPHQNPILLRFQTRLKSLFTIRGFVQVCLFFFCFFFHGESALLCRHDTSNNKKNRNPTT